MHDEIAKTHSEVEEKQKSGRFFTEMHAFLGTLIGGPFMGVYILYHNFKTLGKNDAAKKTVIFGLLLSIIFLVIAFLLPDYLTDGYGAFLLALIPIFTTLGVMNKSQSLTIADKLHKGYKRAGLLEVFAKSFASLIFTFVIILAISIFCFRNL